MTTTNKQSRQPRATTHGASADRSQTVLDDLPLNVVVTGASRGIGSAIARRLTDDGWTVFNLDLQAPQDLEEDAKQTNRIEPEWIETNVADAQSLEQALSRVLDRGPVTGLVNNAAIAHMSALGEVGAEEMDESYAVNQRAPAMCAKALAPGMTEAGFGRIVNIASRAHLGKTQRTAYAATKGAIVSMTKVWALELAANGITCNAVAPGPVRTELFEAVNPPDLPRTQAIVDAVPIRRLGEPDDIANAVAFFMDPRSGYVTGQVLYACGGVTLARGGS